MISFFLRFKLFFIIVFSQLLFASNTPYSYSYIPKKVYINQVFPVTVYVKHYNQKDELSFEFDPLSLIQPINLKPVIINNQNEAFFTFYFKVKKNSNTIEIPTLTIWNTQHSYILNPHEIKVEKLSSKNETNFSNLIASNFRINNVKIDPYDSKYILVTMNLSAKEANLEDFHIPNVIDDGIEKLKRDGANVNAKYYFIIKNSVDHIDFSYYNNIKKSFIEKKLNLNDYKNRIIAQDFSPKELTFDKLKKYVIYLLAVFFLLMFILTKDKLYLTIVILILLYIGYLFFSKKTICIKEGASLYILPTNNSSIFSRIDEKLHKNVIKKYKNFYKINLKNNMTGWIKDEDVCQD